MRSDGWFGQEDLYARGGGILLQTNTRKYAQMRASGAHAEMLFVRNTDKYAHEKRGFSRYYFAKHRVNARQIHIIANSNMGGKWR